MSPHAAPSHGSLPPSEPSEVTLGGSGEVTLGVMGGGQLGRMFVQAAQQMGFFTAVLDADPLSPAGRVSHHHIQTAYTDVDGLQRLAQRCVAVTTEFENVPAQSLAALAQTVTVSPGADCVAISQDRAREKSYFANCGVPVAPYAVIETAQQLAALVGDLSAAPGHPKQAGAPSGGSEVHAVTSVGPDLFPGILKTSRMGYDGKGQARVADGAALAAAWAALGGVPCVLEKMLPLLLECSVIVARGADGACVNLPVQRNLHRDGILAVTEVYEGNLPPALVERAVAAAKSIANGLQYVGVLCVEFFVLDPESTAAQTLGGLVVNEMAPRPHNSGHYSMDACDVSQFALQVRTLAGLPLTQPRQHSPSIMLNLLGDIWPENRGHENRGQIPIQDGTRSEVHSAATKLDSDPNSADPNSDPNFPFHDPNFQAVLALPGTHLHLYGKAHAAKGRKMGHLTITAASIAQVRATALQAAAILGIAAF